MPLRRLWAGLPLAVLVALLAHVAGFGFAHVPGGGHVASLLVTLAVALAALALAAFARAVFTRRSIATTTDVRKSAAWLAFLGAVAFAAIELAEGHGIFDAGLRPLLTTLPLALVVALFARGADRALARVAARIATYLRRERARTGSDYLGRTRARIATVAHDVRRATCGRAPPRFA